MTCRKTYLFVVTENGTEVVVLLFGDLSWQNNEVSQVLAPLRIKKRFYIMIGYFLRPNTVFYNDLRQTKHKSTRTVARRFRNPDAIKKHGGDV